MGRRKKAVDWLEIQRRYTLGDSARKISRDHDISHVAISDRAKKEGWEVNQQLAGLPETVKQTDTAKTFAVPENAAQKKQIRLGITSPENAQYIIEQVERGIMPYTAARLAGLTRRTFDDWLERDVYLAGKLRSASARADSLLEGKIHDVGMQGDARAAKDYLVAKERKSWSDGSSGGKGGIQVTINLDRAAAPGVTIDSDAEDIT